MILWGLWIGVIVVSIVVLAVIDVVKQRRVMRERVQEAVERSKRA